MNEYRSAAQVALLEVHPAERPNFNDLLNNAEAGIVKRGIADPDLLGNLGIAHVLGTEFNKLLHLFKSCRHLLIIMK